MNKKRNIGGILAQIQKTERFEHREVVDVDGPLQPTRFGTPLMRIEEGSFRIDLSGVRIFSGLPDLVAHLAAQFEEQARLPGTDVLARFAVQPDLTPELTELKIGAVILTARSGVARRVVTTRDVLPRQLRLALGALQNRNIQDALFGRVQPAKDESSPEPTAWIFPFGDGGEGASDAFLLMEYEPEGAFLRLIVEIGHDNRLQLKRIRHRVFEERDRQTWAHDVPAMAEKVALGIHHAGQNNREFFLEEPSRQPGLFAVMSAAGLPGVTQLRFTWSNRDLTAFLMGHDPKMRDLIAKVLLMLEDETVIRTLAGKNSIEMISDQRRVYLDVSRRGVCLNVAFGTPRLRADLTGFLRRLPRLDDASRRAGPSFEQTRIVFIHHLTAETLAFIRAVQETGCAFMHGLFIRYKGITPDSYLDALMSLPEDRFLFHSLHNLEKEGQLTGCYVLSRQFSPIEPLQALAERLRQTPSDYFTAMRLAACHVVMLELLQAWKKHQRVLLVEDGGYVAPELNRWVLQGMSLGEAMQRCEHDSEVLRRDHPDLPLNRPLGEWLGGVLAAGVEHTRNGYDQLVSVKQEYGALSFPVYTIALSDYKNREEARDAATSILMACEYILSGQGESLYFRRAIVIGSRGNIGRCLLNQLNHRLAPDGVVGVDIVIGPRPARGLLCEAPEYGEFASVPPARLRETDLIIGMTARPVLTPRIVTEILLRGNRRRLHLVSGSTKNVEFAAVLSWLQEVRQAEHPCIEDFPVRIESRLLLDPLTEINQGTVVRVVFTGERLPAGVAPAAPFKEIVLAGDGMPLNFNFFGVPGETMDEVMRQLLAMCAVAVRRPPNAPDIYALDVDMDEQGGLLPKQDAPITNEKKTS